MCRPGEERGGGCRFSDPAGIHHDYPIGPSGHDAEIVRDQQDRHAAGDAQAIKQFEDLRLDGDVECRGGFIGHQQLGLARERDGDHHALAHPAAQLVRITVDSFRWVGDPHFAEQCDGPLPRVRAIHRLVGTDRLGDLCPDAHHRIEGGQRILEDHRDASAAITPEFALGQSGEVGALEANVGRGIELRTWRKQPRECQASERLAAARLAHQGHDLARRHREAHPVDRDDRRAVVAAESDAQVGDVEQRGHVASGWKTRRSASPSNVAAEVAATKAAPGTRASHGAVVK